MIHQPNKNIYNVVVVLWLTLSIGSVVLAALTWSRLSQLVAAGHEVATIRENLSQVLNLLLEAETGARGYVITDDKRYLQTLNESETNLPACFDALARAAQGETDLLGRLESLHAQAAVALDWQFKIVDARDHIFGRSQDLIATGNGKTIMDGVRSQIADLIKIHLERRARIREEFSAQLFRASLTSLVAAILGLGAGVYAFWLSRVTSRHQQLERELMEAKLRAEHNSAEKNIFLANMSHEIRTPMNAILGFSELLLDDLREPVQRHYVQSILASANSLLTLINDILDVSKIEAGVMVLRPEPTDPRDICQLVQTLFSEVAAKKGIKLHYRVAADLPRALLVDRVRLRQVLVNLTGNAVKFTDAGSVETRVNWAKQNDSSHLTLIIEVQDTGIGIPADKLATIFKPFAQAGAHREKETQGTGLGLAIVQRLVELMGGTVTVASVLGQGSAFHLRLPNVGISARLVGSEKNSRVASVEFNDLQPATLLVVDDNELNCQLMTGMFAGTHHRLVFAATGEEALARVREIHPDIILLDFRLPGLSGPDTLVQIRKISGFELTPVIAVTASSALDGEPPGQEQFGGYVRKPFTRHELFQELAGFLPRHLHRKEIAEPPRVIPGPVAPDPALVAQLRRLLLHPWPGIRDSVAVNESRNFARNLASLGKQWECPELVAYAQIILDDVDNYAVADLENHLGQFAALVEQLEHSAHSIAK